ncbi:hypothetical protein Efla_007828 [Eimeria flavescens]
MALLQQLQTTELATSHLKTDEHFVTEFEAAKEKAERVEAEKNKGEAALAKLAMLKVRKHRRFKSSSSILSLRLARQQTALIEYREMHALLQQENEQREKQREALRTAEERLEAAEGQAKELQDLMGELENRSKEQTDITQQLRSMRRQVDARIEEEEEEAAVQERTKAQEEKAEEETLLQESKEEVLFLEGKLEQTKKYKSDLLQAAALEAELKALRQDEGQRLLREKLKKEEELKQQIESLEREVENNSKHLNSLHPAEHSKR